MAGFIGINLLTANSQGTPGEGAASYADDQLRAFIEKERNKCQGGRYLLELKRCSRGGAGLLQSRRSERRGTIDVEEKQIVLMYLFIFSD